MDVIKPLDAKTQTYREIAECAIRLICGANVTQRLDHTVELIHCRSIYRFPNHVYGRALALEKKVSREMMRQSGYNSLLDAEAILRARRYIDDLLFEELSEARLKVTFLQNGDSGCAWWRCTEPARIINEIYAGQIIAESRRDIEYAAFLNSDIIVVQRGLFGEEGVKDIHALIDRLKQMGKKIIYEIDDDLEGMPPSNHAVEVYGVNVRAFVNWLRRESDAIITSVERLKDLNSFPEKTFVIENSIDLEQFRQPVRAEDRDDTIFVLWQGGSSHDKDWLWCAESLNYFLAGDPRRGGRTPKQTLEDATKKSIVFGSFGYMPDFIRAYQERVLKGPSFYMRGAEKLMQGTDIEFSIKGRYDIRQFQAVPVQTFHQNYINLQPDIALAMLDPKQVFNASKSSIKFLEATLAGAPCVVTNFGPYASLPDDVCLKARTPEKFTAAIRELITNEKLREDIVLKAKAFVEEKYSLRKNIYKWVEVFDFVRIKQEVSDVAQQ